MRLEDTKEFGQRIVKLVNNAFLEGNNRVVGNRDMFGTNLRATLGDVAKTNPLIVLQI